MGNTFRKALYVIWPDFDYIEKCINAGIKYIIVANQNLYPSDDSEWNHWGSYEDTMAIIDKYRNDSRIELILCPVFVTFWKDQPEDESFVDKNGNLCRRTPCPLNPKTILDRVRRALHICNENNIKHLYWDPEHYHHGPSLPNEVKDFDFRNIGPKHKCYCDRCKAFDLNKKEQWDIYCGSIFNVLKEDSSIESHGQLCHSAGWNFARYPKSINGKKWCFTEKTYSKDGRFNTISDWINLTIEKILGKILFNQTMNFSAGAWIEKFTAQDYLKYIESLGKCSFFEGYWIYSHMRLSKNSYRRIHEDLPDVYLEGSGLYYTTYIDKAMPEFFDELKKVHDKIDKYRNSWIFKLRSIFKI